MRSTFSILPYINRNKVKADGTTAVLCRITIDGKSSTMATGIYCKPEDWNSKTGTIRTVRENNRLQEFRKSVELAYDETLKKQNVVSAELLKNTLAKRAVIPTKLLQMGERERERLLARSKEINSTSTYRHSGYYQKYLKDYLTSLGKEDIEFCDITEERVLRHHGGVWKFLQGVSETLQELRSVTDEQVPVLAEQISVPRRGLRDTPRQPVGGHGIREEARAEAQAHQPCGTESHP